MRRLDTGPRGLLEAEAHERLLRYGENVVLPQGVAGRPRRLLRALRDPFTAVLLCLGTGSAVIGSWGTACVIAALVVVSCVLRAAGEYRADRSAAALRKLVASTATVVRRAAGAAQPLAREIPVDELVPGDVVRLGPGDMVPADVRLLRADGLTVHQATLTGESAPVPKCADAMPGDHGDSLYDQPHLCFAGTSVASGTATGVVTATGPRTHFASAHGGLARRRVSAFDRSVNGVSWTLIRFMALTVALVLTACAMVTGRGLEMLPFAVALAVGMTPEMLPVVVTTALARGTAELAGQADVIVKRLPALHDLGAIDVLCTDKTGTLTRDALTVACHLDAEGRDDPEVLYWAAINSLWTIELADAPSADALDEAILRAADNAAADDGDAEADTAADADTDASDDAAAGPGRRAPTGVDAIGFDPSRRLSTAVVLRPGSLGVHTLVVKGAVEEVVERCTMDDAARTRILALATEQADAGLRLLAVATADRPARSRPYTPADERGLTLLGIVGLRDEPAPGAADALDALARRGIAVKLLTGDHPGTAARICRDLQLDPGEVVTGDRIDALDDRGLAELARGTTVFARCTPAHKTRVVSALRDARYGGHTVGFLGDGVNDVPALLAADVAIAPRDAVDAARESADVVLAAKELTAIDRAVTAGRATTANIATYLRVAVSSNLGNVFSMLTAGLLLPFLPMLPVQVLVQNLCFDASQLAFAFGRSGPATPDRPSVLRPFAFDRYITVFGVINAMADLATFAVLGLVAPLSRSTSGQGLFHAGWFTENLITQAMVMVLLRGMGGRLPRVPGPLRLATGALAAVGLLLPLSPLARPLHLAALPPQYYALLLVVLAAYGGALALARRSTTSVLGSPVPAGDPGGPACGQPPAPLPAGVADDRLGRTPAGGQDRNGSETVGGASEVGA
ncbi:magnesium-translocating P-type ATPase [Streptomyces humicola]|uniref:magnesium-translocating P-type ATPase n=1 Tax=Streptomyces humicola TaxID=2953240 RepID=UPI0035576681